MDGMTESALMDNSLSFMNKNQATFVLFTSEKKLNCSLKNPYRG